VLKSSENEEVKRMKETNFRIRVKSTNELSNIARIDFISKEVFVLKEFDGYLEEFIYTFDEVDFIESTGLKDKNDKEIFEKDIVDIHGQKLIVHLGKHAYDSRDLLVGGLYREVYGFYLESPCGSWEVNIAVVLDDLEVIGNIYENPELLGDSK